MWKNLATGCLTLGFVLVGCASDPEPVSAREDPAVEGFFRRREGSAGKIEWVAFEPATKYTLQRTGETSFEEGTYTFDEAKTSVTFRASTGQSTTSAISVIDGGAGVGAGLTRTATADLEPRDQLVRPAGGLLIDGGELERVAGAFFCKDAALINPMSSNCGRAQGPCPAGKIYCVKLMG
jgi:hypothetical protein